MIAVPSSPCFWVKGEEGTSMWGEEAEVSGKEGYFGCRRPLMGFLGHWNPNWTGGSGADLPPPTMKFPLNPSSEKG